MNKNKRFTYEYDEYNGNLFDNEMNTFYHIEDSEENIQWFCTHLNDLDNARRENENIARMYLEENKKLKSQLDYIQSAISKAIKHQKTELGQKALKEVIEDYNEWLLGHK